jgi:hypothetical protein
MFNLTQEILMKTFKTLIFLKKLNSEIKNSSRAPLLRTKAFESPKRLLLTKKLPSQEKAQPLK